MTAITLERSGGATNCVEAGSLPAIVAVRDSKDPEGALTFAPGAWDAFTGAVKNDKYDKR